MNRYEGRRGHDREAHLSFRVDFYISVYKTRFEEQKVQTTFANTKFCQAHQIGEELSRIEILDI